MRPGQNKRMRGRNHRKGPNPLTRSFESNGPDVKIRGTAQHIAEKYLQLARDAQSSGDPVMAESYLQHAEHYYRVIAAAQQAQQAAMGFQGGGRPPADLEDEDDEDDYVNDRFASVSERLPAPPPALQPQAGPPQAGPPNGQPYYNERPQFQGGGDRNNGRAFRPEGPNQERPERQDRPERQERQERPFQQNRQNFRQDQPRFRDNRSEQVEPPAEEQPGGLPAFITGARVEAPPAPAEPEQSGGGSEVNEGHGYHLRPRRRRRGRSGEGEAVQDVETAPVSE
jgi:hypothetical protein